MRSKLTVFSLMVMLTVAMPVFGAGMTYTQSETPPALNVALEHTTDTGYNGVLLQITPANNDGIGTERSNAQSFTTIDAFELGAVSFKNPPNTLSFGEGQVGALAILDGANNCVGGPFTCLYPNITNGHWTVLTLDAPVSLATETQYKFVFTLIGPISENLRCWGDRNAGYAGGQMMTPAYEAGTFPVITTLYTAGRDMYFVLQEYVDTGVNSEPFVDAGSDAAIYLQSYRDGGNIVIDASSADDGNIQPLTYEWSVVGDDTNVSFVATNVENPNVTFSALGSYELQLEVYDGEFYASDTVVITVIDNVDPTADAGADQLVSLVDGGTVVLAGTAGDDGEPSDVGGYVLTTTWSVTAQPAGSDVIFGDASSLMTTAAFDTAGEYTLLLTVDDSGGNPAVDTIVVSVMQYPMAQITLNPTDDTYVRSTRVNWNYGGKDTLSVMNSLAGNETTGIEVRLGLLKFDVNGQVPGAVENATLRMFSKDAMAETRILAMTYGSSGEWFEGDGVGDPYFAPDTTGVGITWNTFDLVQGPVLDYVAPIADESWYEFDVSGMVMENDGKVTIGMDAPDMNVAGEEWRTKEGYEVPKLIVTYKSGVAYTLVPIPGQIEVHPDIVLTWNAGVGADTEEIYFGEAGSMVLVNTNIVGVNPNEYDPSPDGGLTLGTTYEWQIISKAGGNVIGDTGVRTFIVSPTLPQQILTIGVIPNNLGISSIDPSLGEHPYYRNTTVNLNATRFVECPNVYRFDHWVGDVADSDSAVTTVFMDSDKTVTAVFVEGAVCGDECHPNFTLGDLNHDCYVNLEDIAIITSRWLNCFAPECD